MTTKVNLNEQLKRYFGFDSFKGDQEAIIRNLLDGNDTFVLMPTGGGKSLCYQLPSLIMDGTAIVVSPLIALMKNQVDVINGLSEENGVAHYLNSSLNKSAVQQVTDDIHSGKTKLLYVAPESLNKEDNQALFQSMRISFYAIDEAHCISEWGHDFRPEYRNIRPTINRIGQAPVIALTATATEKVRTDIKKNLGIADAKEFRSSFNRPNLYYEVRQKTKDVDKQIVKFIKQNAGKSGIIYCISRKKVEELATVLRLNDIKAAPYHAGLDSATRSATQDDFLMERIDVIVATIAFGMGIDKPDVRFVMHYDIPKSLEGYYQETGRAGRDGGEGQCIAFYSHRDLQKLEKFMEGKPIAEQDIGRQLLQETAAYAESSVCRRKLLLHYFGETYTQENCGNCDNCLHPKERREGKDLLVIVLKAILATKENFRQNYIIDFVKGRATDEIVSHKHDQLDVFGDGEDADPKLWNPVIRQGIISGYINKEVENYGILKVTAGGRRFISHPQSFMIVEDRDFHGDDGDEEQGGKAVLDPQLYAMLKDLRKSVAHKLNLPGYVVFQDVSLEQMATLYPVTLKELHNIQGVGMGKAKRYGEPFCDLIRKYCEENEILRPEEFVFRSAPKSTNIQKLVTYIERQLPLDEIAKMMGWEYEELLDKIDVLVQNGVRINIDYYLKSFLDDDQIEEIYEFFQENRDFANPDEAMEGAISELGEYYEDNEIRLVRIKFLSEVAN